MVTESDSHKPYVSASKILPEITTQGIILAIVLGIFVCILLLFIKGKDAQIQPGFSVNTSVSTTMNIEV